METSVMEKNASLFCRAVQSPGHISVSEFARGKAWREQLDKSGCIEVTDRAGSVGLLLTPECAKSVSYYIATLEEELEQAQVERLFELRRGYSEPECGETLLNDSMKKLEELEPKIQEFLDAD